MAHYVANKFATERNLGPAATARLYQQVERLAAAAWNAEPPGLMPARLNLADDWQQVVKSVRKIQHSQQLRVLSVREFAGRRRINVRTLYHWIPRGRVSVVQSHPYRLDPASVLQERPQAFYRRVARLRSSSAKAPEVGQPPGGQGARPETS